MSNFYNTKHETLITGTSAADSILNHGHHVTISTGNGDDTVDNIWDSTYTYKSADSVSINTGAGNDSVYNEGEECTINTGAGNDSVSSANRDFVAVIFDIISRARACDKR